VKTISPVSIPTTLDNRFDLKNEPCPQSWKIIKILTIKPAASTDKSKVSRYENRIVYSITPQRIIYGPTELIICHQLRIGSGELYLETISIHCAFLPFCPLFIYTYFELM
jgi:hypothetical protein